MTEENRRKNAAQEIARGQKSLGAAEVLLERGFFEDAVSRAYSAAFHFARALLLTEGVQVRSHAGVRDQLSLHFVVAGRLSPDVVGQLARLQGLREQSDYDTAAVFSKALAEEALAETRAFVEAINQQLDLS